MSKAKYEPRPLMKRFYTAVGYALAGDSYMITLDGKRIKTPARLELRAPTETMAQAVADEWRAQGEYIDTDAMPLTRLLNITLDRVPADRDALLAEICSYGETDLLCYRMPRDVQGLFNASTAALRDAQDATFDPILQWMDDAYGITFAITDGIMPVAQQADTTAALHAVFAQASNGELAALSMMLPILGSALLVLAVWKKQITLPQALLAARLDEDEQARHWGMDAEVQAKWQAKCRDVEATGFFLEALHT